jgi:hypothetical protein
MAKHHPALSTDLAGGDTLGAMNGLTAKLVFVLVAALAVPLLKIWALKRGRRTTRKRTRFSPRRDS